MFSKTKLIEQIKKKKSFLCVGLDTDLQRIPEFLKKEEDPIFEFNKRIIDATKDYCVAYKPNLAFYERYGSKGWQALEKTIGYIPDDLFIIADAKRGDIGNTSTQYAKAFFEELQVDAITVAPYMGIDSVTPFLGYEGKWVILLALTSNKGSQDFQFLTLNDSDLLYQKVLEVSKQWGSSEELMYVVGATHPSEINKVRAIIPDHFLLIPGVGAQGGDLQTIAKSAINSEIGILINSSRSIIYAGQEEDFALKAQEKAKAYQLEMEKILKSYNHIP